MERAGGRADRAVLRGAVTRLNGAGSGAAGQQMPGRGAVRSGRFLPEMVVTRDSHAPSKQGKGGTKIMLKANYFRLTRSENMCVFQYRIDVEPIIEDVGLMYALVKSQGPVLGPYIFEGTMLFLYNKLRSDVLELQIRDPRTENLYKMKIRHVGTVDMQSTMGLMILNLMQRQAMNSLQLLVMNRHHFDPKAKISIPQYNLELYPGYITSIRQHEKDVLLCVELTYRVLRTDTVYKMLSDQRNVPGAYKENFKRTIIGSVVMCTYNSKSYKITDVDFNTTPSSSFSKKDGGSITFMQYFKDTYNVTIRDPMQPMLVSTPTTRMQRSGITTPILLVPELCRMTGITDAMRKDFNLMRSIADHTRIGPDQRLERLDRFNRRLQETGASREVFNFWKTELDRRIVELPGRILESEIVTMAKDVPVGSDADWSKALHDNRMFKSSALKRWFLVCEANKQRMVEDFVAAMMKVAPRLGFQLGQPEIVNIPNDSPQVYHQILGQLVNRDPPFIMCLVSNDRADRYRVIKKKCCVDRAVPTQVIKARTISKPPGALLTVATKVIIQINCKLGGVPWVTRNPMTDIVILGYDVCHDARDRSKSYGAVTATMFGANPRDSRQFSCVEQHGKGEELSNFMSSAVAKVLRAYQREFGPDRLPRRFLLYRDGVGDGQLRQVVDHEVQAIRMRLDAAYADYQPHKPRLCVIVVSKRINTRLFANGRNPPPGTVVDDVITLPERTDFFLISQSTRHGTVSPTSYNIIVNEIGLNAEQLQTYTYRQTLMYYNWCGGVRVPAVCQYAHKLAFLVSQYLQQQPNEQLEKCLYYL
ncbi:protein aubergine-like [Anopheles albimanus]|uniref:Piwi n=1 Tax=Anopheles albimanus TaxID=7167 RepID=A0A182FVH9_ANOAL|nr:protein aubergine-like [Anopheles albimanus]XP_035789142.1 protein aubergine-like [Anopheles albimanus]